MNAQEHYAEALKILSEGESWDWGDAVTTQTIAVAQVHATLALAAATGCNSTERADRLAWIDATSPQAQVGPFDAAEDDQPTPGWTCRAFVWVGQSFASCDACGRPFWEHTHKRGLGVDAGRIVPLEPAEAEAVKRRHQAVIR